MNRKILFSFRRSSLKTKWALTSAVVIFISFAIICSVLYWSMHTWLLSQEHQSVNRTMDDLQVFFESQGSGMTIDEIRSNRGLMNSIIDKNQTVRILNKDGIEILRINDTINQIPEIKKQVPSQGYIVEKEKLEGIDCFVATSKLQMSPFLGYIQLTHPLDSFHSLMNYLLMAMCILGLGALIISFYIGHFLANFLLRPLHELRLEMLNVAEEGFGTPILMEYSYEDEIGDLLQVYRKMMAELEQTFLLQQQFVQDASHELRTPIQVVEGHLSLIKRWGKDDPAILQESLETSLTEIKRMKDLVEEMLELARGEGVAQDSHCNVEETIREIVEEQLHLYPSVKIEVVKNHFTNVYAAISQRALGQIVRNLLQNAIRYSNQDAKIFVCLTIEGKNCKIEVEDHGIGIAESDLPYIFERFYRVDQARSREEGGTGLGLSIVHMLVNKYGGKIFVSSKLGEGTKFQITFPLENNQI